MTQFKPGLFLTFEGGEGAGKTTQIKYLSQYLEQQGHEVTITREPGGTQLGEAVRGVLMGQYDHDMPAMSELLLMFAARAAHLEEVIEPALARGEIVLCDRFTDASFAYQGVARGLGESAVATLEHLVQRHRYPDGVLLLDIPVEAGLDRVHERQDTNRFDQEKQAFHERVRSAYLERAAQQPQRYAVIDASRPAVEVAQSVWQAVEHWL